jgi:hypothetical protein
MTTEQKHFNCAVNVLSGTNCTSNRTPSMRNASVAARTSAFGGTFTT